MICNNNRLQWCCLCRTHTLYRCNVIAQPSLPSRSRAPPHRHIWQIREPKWPYVFFFALLLYSNRCIVENLSIEFYTVEYLFVKCFERKKSSFFVESAKIILILWKFRVIQRLKSVGLLWITCIEFNENNCRLMKSLGILLKIRNRPRRCRIVVVEIENQPSILDSY